jgi:hypothetical protein
MWSCRSFRACAVKTNIRQLLSPPAAILFFVKPSLQGAMLKLSWQAAILCHQSPLQVVKQISTILQTIILFPVDPDPAFQNVPGSDPILFKNLFEI